MEKQAIRQRYFVQILSREAAGAVALPVGKALAWSEQRPLRLSARQKASHAQLLLVAREAKVWAERLPGAPGFFLNEVQIKQGAWMRPGDEIRLGGARLLLCAEAERPLASPRVLSFVELEERLREALYAPGEGQCPVLFLVWLPHLNTPARQAFQKRLMREIHGWQHAAFWATLAWDIWACVLPAAPVEHADRWRQRLEVAAGKSARLAWVRWPVDGTSAAGLLERAWTKLGKIDARIEPVLENAAMVRLVSMLRELQKAPGPVLIYGGEGQGRAWLLSQWLEGTPHEEYEAMALLEAEPSCGALVLKGFDALPAWRRQQLLAKAKAERWRLGATALRPFEEAAHFPWAFRVPSLAARPEDIWPLAQAAVASVKQKTNRPGLYLGEPLRERLEGYGFPGGVRELKNWAVQAAVASLRDEVGKEALPSALRAQEAPGSYAEQMAAAEYGIVLESLVRARWNVSAAAKRLGIARRTLVFRMAKLGFKRPQH